MDKSFESEIIIPIYNYKLKIVICSEVKDYILTNKIFEESEECKAIVLDFENDKTVKYNSIVIFSDNNIKTELIAHEAFHVVCLLAKSRGFTLTESSEECFAYLQGYITKALTTNLLKLKQIKNGDTDS